jgi:hypothetical protein
VQPHRESIPIVLATTMGTDQWDVSLPIDIPVQSIIQRLLESAELPFRAQDDVGGAMPWRLMWKQRGRYLLESETLRSAGVQPNDTLVMTIEARAGTVLRQRTAFRQRTVLGKRTP